MLLRSKFLQTNVCCYISLRRVIESGVPATHKNDPHFSSRASYVLRNEMSLHCNLRNTHLFELELEDVCDMYHSCNYRVCFMWRQTTKIICKQNYPRGWKRYKGWYSEGFHKIFQIINYPRVLICNVLVL